MTSEKLKVLDLFSGIGGFTKGLEATNGFKTVAFCEIDPFCQKILNKHWPNTPIFGDIKNITENDLKSLNTGIDVVCGGFPCRPISIAGQKKADLDERWLWPEFYRIICMVRPKWVLVENVTGLLNVLDKSGERIFGGILRDLSFIGYDAEWQVVSAAEFGAPHLRKRVFVIAHSLADADCGMLEIGKTNKTKFDIECERIFSRTVKRSSDFWIVEPDICRMVDGIPDRVDRIKALTIFKSITNMNSFEQNVFIQDIRLLS